MNKVQLKVLENNIANEIKSTQEKIDEYSKLCKPIAPENSIGRISRMDAINNKSVVEAALRVSIEKIKQLKTMQNKTNNSDFGICNKCKQVIPFGRLLIQPHSKFCVICAQ
jgi:DnaK suppressor protein